MKIALFIPMPYMPTVAPVPQMRLRSFSPASQTSHTVTPFGSTRVMEPAGQPETPGVWNALKCPTKPGISKLDCSRVGTRAVKRSDGLNGSKVLRGVVVLACAAYSKIDSVMDDSVEKIPVAMQKASALVQARIGPMGEKVQRLMADFQKDLEKTK